MSRIIGLFITFIVGVRSISPLESSALLDFYFNSTNGPQWTNNNGWGQGDPCTDRWFGITCSISNTITQITLPQNNISGTIPSTIGNLYDLQYLFLHYNNLSGTIPSTIGNFSNLQYLYLAHNNLSGTIPSTIRYLSNLRTIDLSYNNLSGTIPSTIGKFYYLQYLNLAHNNLSGTILSTIPFGNLTMLKYLDISQNPDLSCSLFLSLLNLNNLTYCDVRNTSCECTINIFLSPCYVPCTPTPVIEPQSSAPTSRPAIEPQSSAPTSTPAIEPQSSAPTSTSNISVINVTEFLSFGKNLTFNVISSITVIGDIEFNTTTTLVVQENATIDIKGCVILSGYLILNISGLGQPKRLNPINAECFINNAFDHVEILGSPTCYQSKPKQTIENQSYFVLLSFQNTCNDKFPVYGIVLIAVFAGFAVVLIILSFAVPSIRRKIPRL